MLNIYMDHEAIRKIIEDSGHREIIGGRWDEIGNWQKDFLIDNGLKKDNIFIDIGCGSLRGGVKIVDWLDAGNYFAIDISGPLIEAGYAAEIAGTHLAAKLPRENLYVTDDFEIPFDRLFDMGIAVSVFTHLPISRLTRCLNQAGNRFRSGGRFFFTVFIGEGDLVQQKEVITHPDRDPFHVTVDEIRRAVPANWHMDWIGEVGHARGQQMAVVTRR